jgi:ATP-dependent DNA helicase RecQ
LTLVGKEEFFSHLDALAQKHFSISELRPLQREVFSALNSSRQVLAMLPTGAGKTLIYALGSLFFPDSVTIVVCPLIALMRDQHQRMRAAGISSSMICSEQTDDERKESFRDLLRGESKLLFVSPERFAMVGFQKFLRRLRIGMIVIDEAHCVVTWGHSFRPEYGQLSSVMAGLEPKRILALTATASRSSRSLIKEMIFSEPESVFEVIDRPLRDNIQVKAIRAFSEDERWSVIENLVLATSSSKSIIYFQRREQCQKAALEMKKKGVFAIVYHAGLSRELRKSAEEYLRQSNRKIVICATLAFGMGIDLPNVGMVVVAGFPGNIEEMFQMIGRAGRGGELAEGVLVWTGSDPKKRQFQFEKMLPESSDFLERLRPLAPLFPGVQQSKLMAKSELLERTYAGHLERGRQEQFWSTLAGTLTMLGLGKSLDMEREAWIDLQIRDVEKFFNAIAILPSGPSRRRRVLEWVVHRFGLDTVLRGRFSCAFSVGEIVEETQLAWEKIAEVLKFYSQQNEVQISFIPRENLNQHYVLFGSFNELEGRFPKYHRWRNALFQGHLGMSHFVSTEKCRLQEAFKLFSVQTGAAGHWRIESCGKCDNCCKVSKMQARYVRPTSAGSLTLSLPNRP